MRPAEAQHRGTDERVVEDHVRIGEDGSRAHREQIGVTRPGAGEHHLPHRRRGRRRRERPARWSAQGPRRPRLAVTQHRRGAASEAIAGRRVAERRLRPRLDGAGVASAPSSCVNGPHSSPSMRLETLSQRSGEERALAGRRDRDLERAALHQRGCDPVALMRDIGDVEEHALASPPLPGARAGRPDRHSHRRRDTRLPGHRAGTNGEDGPPSPRRPAGLGLSRRRARCRRARRSAARGDPGRPGNTRWHSHRALGDGHRPAALARR